MAVNDKNIFVHFVPFANKIISKQATIQNIPFSDSIPFFYLLCKF